jgi:hypothetical protein
VLTSPLLFSKAKKKPRYFYLGLGFIDRIVELNWRLKQEGRINKVLGTQEIEKGLTMASKYKKPNCLWATRAVIPNTNI